MSEVVQVHKEVKLVWREKEYILTRPNFGTEGAMSTFLEARQAAAIRRNRAVLGDEGFRAALQELSRDCAKGVWDWGSVDTSQALQNPACFRELLFLILGQKHPEITRKTVEEMFAEDEALVVRSWNELMRVNPTTAPSPGEPAGSS